MALSPYREPGNYFNRSRSSSCSSPVRNRIVFHEVFSIGANTLVRSYSCSHVLDKDENGDSFQATQIQFSSFITPEKKFRASESRKIRTEPKKFDLNSATSRKLMAKKKLKMIEEPKKMDKINMAKIINYMFWPILLCSIACHFFLDILECTQSWNLELTEKQLQESVFGQDKAIAKINFFLRNFNESNNLMTMVWTGSVGVGKTYSSSIISDNFPWSSNKLVTFPNSLMTGMDGVIKNKLPVCGSSLFIVDDLSPKFVSEATSLVYLIKSKMKAKDKVLIILIFSTCSQEEENLVISRLKETPIHFIHLPFQNLDAEAITKCFHKEMQKQKVVIPTKELKFLVGEQMKKINVLKCSAGCKNVANEVTAFHNEI